MDSPSQKKDLIDLFFRADKAIRKRLETLAESTGLTAAQINVLFDLSDHPDSSLHDVCERLGQPKSSVSRIVDELVHRGLILRQIPPENRRTVILNLVHEASGDCPFDEIAARLNRRNFPDLAPKDEAEVERHLQAVVELLEK